MLHIAKHSLKQIYLFTPDPDGITYPVIKHWSQNLLKSLFNLYNRIWSEQISDAWHNEIVIPFHKLGKNEFDPKNYCPVAPIASVKYLKKKKLYILTLFIY